MQKILFVCLGNICRSPLAEGIALHLVKKYNLNFTIDSAGTAHYHIGEAPDPRTIKNAKLHGIDLSTLIARQFTAADFNNFDIIFVMDKNNLKNIFDLASTPQQKNKVDLFLNTLYPNQNLEVPDPYHEDEKKFEEVFQLLNKACLNLLKIS